MQLMYDPINFSKIDERMKERPISSYDEQNSKIELFDCQESPLPLSIKQLAQFCSDFVINGSRHCVTHRSKYNLYKVY